MLIQWLVKGDHAVYMQYPACFFLQCWSLQYRAGFPSRTLTKLPHSVPQFFSLQTAHFQQCSLNNVHTNNTAIKELASVLFFFFSSRHSHSEFPTCSAFPDRWRIAECGCWDNFSSWKPCQDCPALVLHFRINALLKVFPNLTFKWSKLSDAYYQDLWAFAVQLR